MGWTDMECLLFAWAAGATVAAFKYKEEKDSLGNMLKILFMKPEAREEIFSQFDKFKEKHGL
jgi:hypothetical protein